MSTLCFRLSEPPVKPLRFSAWGYKGVPSSKRCFACGHILENLSLDEREWTCPECQTHHDRDLNASRNVHAAGLAVYACGESARPGVVKTTPGHSRRSRKPSQ